MRDLGLIPPAFYMKSRSASFLFYQEYIKMLKYHQKMIQSFKKWKIKHFLSILDENKMKSKKFRTELKQNWILRFSKLLKILKTIKIIKKLDF